MAWLTIVAIYFLLWWVVLFAVMPFSLKTQDEAGDVTLGTVRSAPRGPHALRAVLRTTLVATALYLAGYGFISWYGFTFDDLPRIVPDFG
jgi:predicted secreted protein